MISAVNISFTQTAALVHAKKHFPVKTPLRWHLIAEYVAKGVPALESRQNVTSTSTYNHSFYETKEGKQHFYKMTSTMEYLQTTTHTVFEVELLKQLTMQLTFSACTLKAKQPFMTQFMVPETKYT